VAVADSPASFVFSISDVNFQVIAIAFANFFLCVIMEGTISCDEINGFALIIGSFPATNDTNGSLN